jgi:ACDE family multidrug resistance protein
MTRVTDTLLYVVLGMAPLLMVLGNSMFIPMLPTIQAEWGLSVVQGGWLLTSFTVPAALLIPISGILSERYGQKRIGLASLVILGTGCVLSSIAVVIETRPFWLLLTGRIIQGLGTGGLTPISLMVASELFSGKKRNEALGFLEVSNGIGKIISPIIGGLILLASWYYSFVVLFALALLAFVGFYTLVNEPKKHETTLSARAYTKKLSQSLQENWKMFVPIFIIGSLGMLILFGYLFAVSNMIGEVSPSWKGVILAVPFLLFAVASFWTSRWLTPEFASFQKAMMAGTTLMTGAMFLMLWQHDRTILFMLVSLFSLGLGMFFPPASAAVAALTNNVSRSVIMPLYSMARFLGVAVGPVIFGFWLERNISIHTMSFFIISLSFFIMCVLWYSGFLRKTNLSHESS